MDEILKETKQSETNTIAPALVNQSKKHTHNYFIFICGAIALLLLGFIGGQSFERARIRHFIGWTNNYERNFFGNQQMPLQNQMMRDLPPDSFRTHAILGKILTAEASKISVQSDDGVEQSIQITNTTAIRHNNDNAKVNDLKNGQRVAIFGQPNNQGQIAATLIRIFDDNTSAPPASPTAMPQQNITN
jgi:hypothetical protein